MHPDLHSTRDAIQAGQTSATAEMQACISRSNEAGHEHVFLATDAEAALAAAADPANARLPLAGLGVTVKDLFDVAGQGTAAGSTVLAGAIPAAKDSAAVALLKAAGGVVLARTNMVEFAFSGVGINPHHGTPANAAASDTPRIPGGSSSGAAISVARGSSFIGLGSDTGGSIRVPAALNGIVGFKNTARLTPADGALPLSTTLDTVCALTRSVRDAVLAHEILSARKVRIAQAPLSSRRFAVAQTTLLDGMDGTVSGAFTRSVQALREAGAQVEEIPLAELRGLAVPEFAIGFSAAESYAWHRGLLEAHGTRYDPRVAARMRRGAPMKAYEYLDMHRARREWITRMEAALQGYDAVLSPTVPIVAPTIASVAPGAERDEEFFRVNALLLRNPSVVNMLDGCAISIPCHVPGELPVGLMVWHGALHDDAVLDIALQAEALLKSPE